MKRQDEKFRCCMCGRVFKEYMRVQGLSDDVCVGCALYEWVGYRAIGTPEEIADHEEMFKAYRYVCGGKSPEEVQQIFAEHKKLAEAKAAGRLVELPCNVGDIVYRICPKCNENHEGSCKNCAWGSAWFQNGCDVFGLWESGEYPANKCTIVPYEVTWNLVPVVRDFIGKRIFLTREAAEAALEGKNEK